MLILIVSGLLSAKILSLAVSSSWLSEAMTHGQWAYRALKTVFTYKFGYISMAVDRVRVHPKGQQSFQCR